MCFHVKLMYKSFPTGNMVAFTARNSCFVRLLSGRNCSLSVVSSTSLILPDRIVQSYPVVSTKEDILVLAFGNTVGKAVIITRLLS